MVDVELIRDRLLKEVLNDSHPDETRSVLLYQAGQIVEMCGGESADALRQYLLALKLEDGFCPPLLTTGSILMAARSTERLNRLMFMALDKLTGRMRALAHLVLAEYIDAAPVTNQDKKSLLSQVAEIPADRTLALVLTEWEHLLEGDADARVSTLRRWIESSRDPLMVSQLGLELACAGGTDPSEAMQLIRQAVRGGADFFPTLPEALRLGCISGDLVTPALIVLEEAGRILETPEASPSDLAQRFILGGPLGAQEAAARLLLTARLLVAASPDARLDPSILEAEHKLMDHIDPGVLLSMGLDGIVVDDLLAAGMHDRLVGYISAIGAPTGNTDAAWNLWNLARAALGRGNFEEVASRLGQIRALGMHSRVLDALESLGVPSSHPQPAGTADQDPVRALIDADASSASRGDASALAQMLASLDSFGPGIADLAYAASRVGMDTFLRKRALEAWFEAGPPLEDLALVDAARLHSIDHPAEQSIIETVLLAPGASSFARSFCLIAALSRLGPVGRMAEIAPGMLELARIALGEAPGEEDGRAGSIVEFVAGPPSSGSGARFEGGALGVHRLLADASRPDTVGRAAQALQIDSAFEGHEDARNLAALLAIETGLTPQDANLIAGSILDGSPDLDPATRLIICLRLGRSDAIMDAMAGLADRMEPGMTRSAVNLLKGLATVARGGDVGAGLEAVRMALDDDPSSVEAMFAFAFLAPAAGRFEDLGAALDALIALGQQDDPWVVTWHRERMLLSLVVHRDLEAALQHADAVQKAQAGDPMAIIVRMAVAGARRDLAGFVRELARLSLWYGDAGDKGRLAYHQLQLESIAAVGDRGEGRLVAPDVANLSHLVSTAALNGPVDLTDAGVQSALDQARSLRSIPHRVRALVELAELVEAAGQSSKALEIFIAALDCDSMEPAAIEGVMRLAHDLEDRASLARACEARASFTSDVKSAVKLLVRAAESYSRDPVTAQRAADCYQRAADLDPSDPRSFTGLLRAMELRGDLVGLIDVIERRVASALDPEEIESLQLKLADLKRKNKDFEGALLALEDLLLVQPGKITALKMKLDLLLQMQRYDRALSAADFLLERVSDKASRVAVLQKCISVSLTRIQDLQAGLKYCLALVSEGGADQDLANKTMRLALRLERWDDAAALQQTMADAAHDPKERVALLLKKAEIHLRYAKDAAAAASVYRQILDHDPMSWDALARWNASLGATGLALEDVEPYLDRVKQQFEEKPLHIEALVFLVKAYRMLRIPAAARHYDAVLKSLSEPAEDGPSPPRTSLAGMLPDMPSSTLAVEDLDFLLGRHGDSAFVVGALSNLGDGGAIPLLASEGELPADPESRPMEPSLPVSRQLQAWASALGIGGLDLLVADGLEGGARISSAGKLVLDASIGHVIPGPTLFRAGVMLGALAMKAPLAAMLSRDRLLEVIKAGFVASGVDPDRLMPADGTLELAERLRMACTAGCLSRLMSFSEVAPSSDASAIERGLSSIEAGLLRAGLFVSGSLPGLIAYRHAFFERSEDMTADQVREYVERDSTLSAGLGFLLGERFGRLRRGLGLEY